MSTAARPFALAAWFLCAGCALQSTTTPPPAGTGGTNTPGAPGGSDELNLPSCVTSSAATQRLPIDLVFMFDRSDSMDRPEKWAPCAAGLKAFLADPVNQGDQVRASLQFFCGKAQSAQACDQETTTWTTPLVPIASLPESTSFAAAIDAQTFCSGTPTVPALTAAHAYADQLRAPDRGRAVVLITDGEPTQCGDVTAVSMVAQSHAMTTRTYVVGVGNVPNLDLIAAAGGTTKAVLVSGTDPMQVSKDFRAALDAIRGQVLGCTYGIPAAPAGNSIDFGKVNVVMAASGQTVPVGYDLGCAKDAGWRYDDPAHPTQIVLCPSVCTMTKADPMAHVQLQFGCGTAVIQ